MEIIQYHNSYFRFIAAFGATLFIVFLGRPFDLSYALSKPMFYMAFFFSLAVALLVVYTIHRITIRLDSVYPWNVAFAERFLYQICLGIITPAGIDFLVFLEYFWAVDQNIFTNGFLAYDFRYVLVLLMLFNLYYYLHYRWLNRKSKQEFDTDLNKTNTLNINHNGVYIHLHVSTDVLCMYKYERIVKVITVHGNEYTTKRSLVQLGTDFANEGICQINQSFLVNLHILKGYAATDKRDSYQPVIKPVYQSAFPASLANEFVLTKKYLDTFRKRLNELQN